MIRSFSRCCALFTQQVCIIAKTRVRAFFCFFFCKGVTFAACRDIPLMSARAHCVLIVITSQRWQENCLISQHLLVIICPSNKKTSVLGDSHDVACHAEASPESETTDLTWRLQIPVHSFTIILLWLFK